MSVADFVEGRLGSDLRKKLEKIGTGGSSNEKGSRYESYFAVAKICSAVAASLQNENFDNYSVSAQEVAFVDDICYKIHDLNEKTNYQAKNSSGRAASWTKDIEDRCLYQKDIDLIYHGAKSSKSVLLVSSKSRRQKNIKKIPVSMRTYCFCEHFPYLENSSSLIMAHKPLRDDLKAICADDNLQTLDTAFKILHSAWATSSSKAQRTVGDIVGEAKRMSRPNIFHALLPEREVPGWLMEKCATFNDCYASVESGVVCVSYNGLKISVPNAADIDNKWQAVLLSTKKVEAFLQSLTDFTKQSFV
ncbi:hypothetical protein [Cronobacter sakazakii]|uniref:hypothetical protein n=1 Tax=Cronobacter sakazakii TaxID=28141 RepID=UPI00131A1303|nr:hypothetical protein [Cronobacter sakazakii]